MVFLMVDLSWICDRIDHFGLSLEALLVFVLLRDVNSNKNEGNGFLFIH